VRRARLSAVGGFSTGARLLGARHRCAGAYRQGTGRQSAPHWFPQQGGASTQELASPLVRALPSRTDLLRQRRGRALQLCVCVCVVVACKHFSTYTRSRHSRHTLTHSRHALALVRFLPRFASSGGDTTRKHTDSERLREEATGSPASVLLSDAVSVSNAPPVRR
jgi:hypothetical protein